MNSFNPEVTSADDCVICPQDDVPPWVVGNDERAALLSALKEVENEMLRCERCGDPLQTMSLRRKFCIACTRGARNHLKITIKPDTAKALQSLVNRHGCTIERAAAMALETWALIQND